MTTYTLFIVCCPACGLSDEQTLMNSTNSFGPLPTLWSDGLVSWSDRTRHRAGFSILINTDLRRCPCGEIFLPSECIVRAIDEDMRPSAGRNSRFTQPSLAEIEKWVRALVPEREGPAVARAWLHVFWESNSALLQDGTEGGSRTRWANFDRRAARALAALGEDTGDDILMLAIGQALRFLGDFERASMTYERMRGEDLPTDARARLLRLCAEQNAGVVPLTPGSRRKGRN